MLLIGKTFGWFVWKFIPIRKKVALKNLSIAFPDKSDTEKNKILKNTYIHFGMVLIDFLRLPFLTLQKLENILTIEEDSIKLLKSTKNGIIVSGHIGNWEMFSPAFGLNNFPFLVVAQSQKNKGANKFFTWARESVGIRIIYKKDSTKKMLLGLKKGFLGLVSDQFAGKSGVVVNFFNRPTSIPKGAAIFYDKTGIPILSGFCILSGDLKYHLSLREMKQSVSMKNTDDLISNVSQQISTDLEKIVTEYPEQYFWFHRKWRRKV